MLPLPPKVDALFVLCGEVVLLLKMPLEVLFVSDKVSASLVESDPEGDAGEESSSERRVNIEANRRLVETRSSRGFCWWGDVGGDWRRADIIVGSRPIG